MSQVSLGRPEFVPGTPPGHPTAKFLYVIFFIGFFSLHIKHIDCELSGPLDRLNAILSLLQPLDHYRTPSATGRAIGRPYLALSRIHMQVGVLNRLNRAIVVL